MIWLQALACDPPPEAPEDLGELSLYLFENFDEDTEALEAGALVMEEFLVEVDPEEDVEYRAVTLPTLTDADLGGAEAPAEADPETQVPVAVMWTSRHSLQDHVELQVEDNQVCIDSSSSVYHHRVFTTDPDCFAAGTCDVLRTLAEVRREEPLTSFWYDVHMDFRTLEVDGSTVLVSRGWIPEIAVSDDGLATFTQSYSLDVRLPDPDDPGTTLRFYALWSALDMVGVTDDLLAIMLRNGIQDSFELADDFVDGVLCDNDRDYTPTRER